MRQLMMGFGDAASSAAPRSGQITTATSHHPVFEEQKLFLMPNQQCQSTEDILPACSNNINTIKPLFGPLQDPP